MADSLSAVGPAQRKGGVLIAPLQSLHNSSHRKPNVFHSPDALHPPRTHRVKLGLAALHSVTASPNFIKLQNITQSTSPKSEFLCTNGFRAEGIQNVGRFTHGPVG